MKRSTLTLLVLVLAIASWSGRAPAQEEEPGSRATATDGVLDEPPESSSPLVDAVSDRGPVLVGTDLIEDDFPGSWPMFGENLRLKIGGYVKADLLYDFDGTTDPFQFLMSTIPVRGSPEYEDDGYLSFFARETRINFDVRRIEEGSPPLRALVEGDFWNDDRQFRLRHAYVVAGDFLVGQTWTTLSVLESLPTMIDFAAGDALFGGRTAQVRYQDRLDDRWKLAIGIESLDFPGIENPGGQGGKASEALPLLAVRTDYQWQSGLLALGTSVAQLRWDGGSSGPDAEALQWAFLVAGRQYLGKDYVTWNLSVGDGAGENIMAFTGSNANAVLTPGGRLDTMSCTAAVLGYMHRWCDQLESNLSYAYGWLDTPDTRAADALAEGGIGHVNLIWKPGARLSYGVEYMHGVQRTTDHSRGAAGRIQFMAKYEF